MDVDPDKSNTEILIEMVEDLASQLERLQEVTESIASAFEAFSQSAETVDITGRLAKHEEALSTFNERMKRSIIPPAHSIIAAINSVRGVVSASIDWRGCDRAALEVVHRESFDREGVAEAIWKTASVAFNPTGKDVIVHHTPDGPIEYWCDLILEGEEDEPEEAEPTIAERLNAGGLSLLEARDLLTVIIEENIAPAKAFDRLDTEHGSGRQFRDCYDPFTVASFTIFKSGKANTGGKDSDLRSAIKAILESEGFDVRC